MSIGYSILPTARAAVPDAPIWRFTLDQYRQMIRSGILTEDDPVELLEGLVVLKLPKNPPHRRAKRRLLDALARMVLNGWYVEDQEPIALDTSAPEPEVFIAAVRRKTTAITTLVPPTWRWSWKSPNRALNGTAE